jgi:hypothetical protein
MIFEVENIKGLYIIPDFFTQEEHDLYFNYLKNDNTNKCNQIHTATEYGWKFIPPRDEKNNIIARTNNDFLDFPDWTLKLKNLIFEKLSLFFQEKNVELNINHMLINKYEIGDGCIMHIDDLEFWSNYIICVSFGSSTVVKFKNPNGDIYDINVPKNSAYIMLEDARCLWQHGIDFVKEDNIHGNIRRRDFRLSVSLREIKKCYLPNK